MTADEAFFKRHRGGSGCVWVVTVYRAGGFVGQGVFSCKEKVLEWLNASYNDDAYSSVSAPYMVDHPDWGNVRTH